MIDFSFFNDIGNYEEREVADKVTVGGITISTAYTSDEGYETALLDANGAHPVERGYRTKEEALAGHKKWIKKVRGGLKKITKLGGFGGWVEDKEVKLEPEEE